MADLMAPPPAPDGPAAQRQGPAPTILFCREVPWNTGLPVSTRKLAERFAMAGWRVVWVVPPRRVPAGARLSVHRVPGAAVHIAELRPRTRISSSLRVPGLWRLLVKRTWHGCAPSLPELLSQAGLNAPDVLWLSHLSALGLPELFSGVPVLWQVTDDYPTLSRNPRRCRALLLQNLERADAVLFTSPLLLERYGRFCRSVRFEPSVLPHGVDAARLRAEPQQAFPLAPARGPRVVYVGNTERADAELLCGLAQSVDVVVIGNPEPLRARALRSPRLYLLGTQPPEMVGRLLAACDLGLVCYSADQLRAAREGGNPMKAYEYAAAGLPILAPELPVFARLNIPVHIYRDLQSLLQHVQRLACPGPGTRAEMRAWAAQHTWEERFLAVEQVVRGLLPSGRA
jgi:glycosyltransferase involved in cell wall biosynthesis